MVLAVVAAVTVNVEGVTAITNGTEDDGTLSGHLLLNHCCPLGIAVEGGTTAIGAGLLHEVGGLGVITADKEGVEDVTHTVNVHTTTTGALGTVRHVLGMADIVHQRGNGSTLCIGVGASVGVEHVVPIEGNRRHCRVGVID